MQIILNNIVGTRAIVLIDDVLDPVTQKVLHVAGSILHREDILQLQKKHTIDYISGWEITASCR